MRVSTSIPNDSQGLVLGESAAGAMFFGQADFVSTKANVVALLPAEGHYFADDRARHLFLET